MPKIACIAGGICEQVNSGGKGEATSETPACLVSYAFCLTPTFITFDDPIK